MTSESHPDGDEIATRRAQMIAQDISARGIRDQRVIEAMAKVPRERFVPADLRRSAYADRPLPIGQGQTISQPFIVALMAEAARVEPGDRVLEIGTGSGYGAAVLSELGGSVVTIERHAPLAAEARRHLSDAGYPDVEVIVGDGTQGWPEGAPYDAIVVTAAGPDVPEPLVAQLAEGGRLVMPVGTRSDAQELIRITREGDRNRRQNLGGVRFVPLVGEHGFDL